MFSSTTSYNSNNHIYFIYILIMKNKLAKIKYLENNFKIIEEGDHVICAVSGKKILLEKLTYWNVELQEAYFSYREAFTKNESLINQKK